MKILFLTISTFSNFPSYKRATGEGAALASRGNEVYIALEDVPENRRRFEFEAKGCVPIWIRKGNVIAEAFQKLRAIRRIRPDFVYSLSYSFRNLKYFSFLFPRQTKYTCEVCELFSAYRFMWIFREWLLLLECDRIVAASKLLRDVFEMRAGGVHIKRPILYHPYAYPVRNRKIEQFASSIVFMAYMSRGYGCFTIMEAFKMITDEYPDVTLEMIGRGPEFQEMTKWVQSENLGQRIHLRGYVEEEDIDSYFSKAICFVSPLRNAITERARCPSKLFYYIPYNRPIVTCNIGNPPDILGAHGYYYEPESAVDMSRAMRQAIHDSKTFSYPLSVVEGNTWDARAAELEAWLCSE